MKKLIKKKKILKVLKMIAGILSAFGFIYILGTAGASDNDAISHQQLIHQSLIGMTLFVGGFLSVLLIETCEIVIEKKIIRQKQFIRRQREESRRSIEEVMRITEHDRRIEQIMKELARL